MGSGFGCFVIRIGALCAGVCDLAADGSVVTTCARPILVPLPSVAPPPVLSTRVTARRAKSASVLRSGVAGRGSLGGLPRRMDAVERMCYCRSLVPAAGTTQRSMSGNGTVAGRLNPNVSSPRSQRPQSKKWSRDGAGGSGREWPRLVSSRNPPFVLSSWDSSACSAPLAVQLHRVG
jgi:hypothetical protein